MKNPVEYSVIVGNVGVVYTGKIMSEARKHYKEYVDQSKTGYGRAGDESVIWFLGEEIYREYVGALDQKNQEEIDG